MPDLGAAALAANRFGLGARPGELRAIAGDPRGWVKAQFAAPYAVPAPIAALPAAEDDLLAFGRWLVVQGLAGPAAERFIARFQGDERRTRRDMRQMPLEQSFVRFFLPRISRALSARMEAALTTDKPAAERLVHFWSNHFTVSTAKPGAVALPPSFERDAIRGHLTGKFADMLLASTKHVGMLVYLDNWLSIGPSSRAASNAGLRRARMPQGANATGLNENLAREILELHTLGVDGGYEQRDVQALAAIISGWTYDRLRGLDFVTDRRADRTGEELFRFVEVAHEPGEHVLLGVSYAQDGVGQGEAALGALAAHPSTARCLATKLARFYIADSPPAGAIARVEAACVQSGGDIRAMMEALVDSPEAWETPFAKFRQPEDYAIAVLRAANVRGLPEGAALAITQTMGQRPYSAPGPDGWPDMTAAWLTADLVWKRLEFAQSYAERLGRADVDPVLLGESVLGPLLQPATRDAVMRAESPVQAFALLFSAPEFQRR